MQRICYASKRFEKESLTRIEQANAIIREYANAGYTLTLRQLFYQFVSRDLLPNTTKSYKNLGILLNNARMAGMVDWEAMEDRTRNLRTVSTWDSPADIVYACSTQFRIDLWADQPVHVNCFVEKDALLGVLEAACDPMQIPYFSCRGYSSASELWSAAMRYVRLIANDKRVVILHLGDHDPSGVDMTRDIEERIRLMIEHHLGEVDDLFNVRRIALNMSQIEEYNPPPNPAKLTDTRAPAYIEEHGESSWELDALAPDVLTQLIEDTAGEYIDDDKWEAAEARQVEARGLLAKAANRWADVEGYLRSL